MKNYWNILIFLSILSSVSAQDICLKLDSIECYRVPWHITSVRNIHKNEIILGESFLSWHVKNVVKDKRALEYFIETNFVDTSRVLSSNESIDDIDARAVIILNYNNGLKDTIVFDARLSYFYGSRVYLSNKKLLLWLQEYNPLLDSKSEFIKAESVNELKEKLNFMIK